jgi:Holliday junction resolvase RusA-like endonuclease
MTIRVYGEPGTAGSKSAGVSYRKGADGKPEPVKTADGRLVTFVKDSSGAKGKAWRSLVADAGAEAMDGREKLSGPLYVEMTFLRARAAGHYGSGRNAGVLKDSAPAYPAVRPDVLKHARATEDSLTGVVWEDDSRVVSGPNEKVFAGRDEALGVEVRIWGLPATVGALRALAMPTLTAALAARYTALTKRNRRSG